MSDTTPSAFDQLVKIRVEIRKHCKSQAGGDPMDVYDLLSDYCDILERLATQRKYSVMATAMDRLNTVAEDLFQRPHMVPVIAELFLERLPFSHRTVFNLAGSLTGVLRENLSQLAVENLIAHEAFLSDRDEHLAGGVIRNLLRYCDNPTPALQYAQSILPLFNSKTSGFESILSAILDSRTLKNMPHEKFVPLVEWVSQLDVLNLCQSLKPGYATKERVAIFREAGLPLLADGLYYKNNQVNAREMIEIHKRTGLKPDTAYLDQFFGQGKTPEVRELRELLKYSLAVENVFPLDWEGIKAPWVTSSLVDAFARLEQMGVRPRSPEECEPLISQLGDHLRSSENMDSLLNKKTKPYLQISHKFNGKLFGLELGL
ncbi:hypothetical protein [Pseudomonas serbica]|uniref:hypothetical protein n=1 Tax=Pseudomonas serbica TaxID=2965074 RepID=UPI00237BAA34|nr:hypothetical protein [Pseudomonas serbica]